MLEWGQIYKATGLQMRKAYKGVHTVGSLESDNKGFISLSHNRWVYIVVLIYTYVANTIYGNYAEKLDTPQHHMGVLCEYYDVDMGEPVPKELIE